MREILSMLLIFLVSYSSIGQEKLSKRDKKKQEVYEELITIIEAEEYEIICEWAMPLGGQSINLMTNPNFLSNNKGEVDLYLPYFGTVQRVKDFGSTTGAIQFKGNPKEYQISTSPEKREIYISFNANNKGEILSFRIKIMGEKARINVNSSDRSSISYEGSVKKLKTNSSN